MCNKLDFIPQTDKMLKPRIWVSMLEFESTPPALHMLQKTVTLLMCSECFYENAVAAVQWSTGGFACGMPLTDLRPSLRTGWQPLTFPRRG